MSAGPLRSFYERPEVPASSGPDRARRQARPAAASILLARACKA